MSSRCWTRVPPEAKPIRLSDVKTLPPGSYLYFLSLRNECVYVGSTRNLKNRLPIHQSYNGPFDSVHYLSVPVGDRLYLERQWKLRLRPRYNADCHRSVIDVAVEDLPEGVVSVAVNDAPSVSCIYFLSLNGRAFYVGRTRELRNRLSGHRSQGKRFDLVHFLCCSTGELIALERQMRLKYGPEFEGNTSLVLNRKRKTIRLMPDGSRAPQICFFVTPKQHDALKSAATAAGKGMSSWIRRELDRAASRPSVETVLVLNQQSMRNQLTPKAGRGRQVHVCVTPRQRKTWKSAAISVGVDMSTWIRIMLAFAYGSHKLHQRLIPFDRPLASTHDKTRRGH
jgi:predicted GIY-YIG superfamily endonuclease